MACRMIVIEVKGDGEYEAAIQEMIESNRRFNQSLVDMGLAHWEEPVPQPFTLKSDQIKEAIVNISQHEREEIYRWLHYTFQCRI